MGCHVNKEMKSSKERQKLLCTRNCDIYFRADSRKSDSKAEATVSNLGMDLEDLQDLSSRARSTAR